MTASAIPAGFVPAVSADPYERNNNLNLIRDSGDGHVEVGLLAEEIHANEYGMVHGGVLMMLADAGLCMNSRWPNPGEGAITVSMTTNFVAGANIGEFLETRSTVIRRTRGFSFMNCDIVSGEKVIMTSTGVIKRVMPKTEG